MRRLCKFLCSIAAMLVPLCASARHIQSYYWGLGANQYTSIAQAPSGLMWFGTDNGIISYNGYQVKTIPHSDKYIYALAIDKPGNLLYADSEGLHKFESAANQTIDIALPLNTGEINSLAISGDILYIGADGTYPEKLF